jgi:hypothetical protein
LAELKKALYAQECSSHVDKAGHQVDKHDQFVFSCKPHYANKFKTITAGPSQAWMYSIYSLPFIFNFVSCNFWFYVCVVKMGNVLNE